MRLHVQIIDPRDTRSGNIASRVLRLLQHTQADRRIERLDYQLTRHISCAAACKAPFVDAEKELTLLHLDESAMDFVEEMARRQGSSTSELRRILVYSGDCIFEGTRGQLEELAGELVQLVVCETRVFGDNEIGSKAGVDQPPVERHLVELLGLPEQALAVPDVLGDPSISAGTDWAAELRHQLINAVCPMREHTSFALATGKLTDGFPEVWRAMHTTFEALSGRLPPWVLPEITALAELLDNLNRDASQRKDRLTAALLGLGRIEQYARSLGQQATDWNSVTAVIKQCVRPHPLKLLWIEDAPAWHKVLQPLLSQCLIDVTFSPTVAEWVRTPERIETFDAVLLDIGLVKQGAAVAAALVQEGLSLAEPVSDSNAGVGLLRLFRAKTDCPPVFMFTATKSSTVIQACLQYGARRYFVKGDSDVFDLITAVHGEVAREDEIRRDCDTPQNRELLLGGREDPLLKVIHQLDKIARAKTRGPVLLRGAVGVGKTQLAKELHLRSPRREGPFEAVNCAEIQAQLAEDKLFGHVIGAFTDAKRSVKGLFELASGGTLFLDEIDKMNLSLQHKLLKAIEEQRIRRVGDDKDVEVDVFVVAASNADLKELVSRGEFSLALYSRISRFPLVVPSLRERAGVIGSFFQLLLARVASERAAEPPRLADDVRPWLESRARADAFEGNIRTLNDLIDRVLTLQADQLQIDAAMLEHALHLGEGEKGPSIDPAALNSTAETLVRIIEAEKPVSLQQVLDRVEGELLRVLLQRYSRSELCHRLGMKDDNLRQKIYQLRKKGVLSPG